MIWPSNLPSTALFNTLHDGKSKHDPLETNGWIISRFRFFFCELHSSSSFIAWLTIEDVFVAGWVWYWVPGYLFKGLSVIAWVTW
jgi:hypothetical protein